MPQLDAFVLLTFCSPSLLSILGESVSFSRFHFRVCGNALWPSHQTAQTQIIDDIFNSLNIVLNRVGTFSQDVVFQIQQLEAGKDVLDEYANGQGQLEVAQRY